MVDNKGNEVASDRFEATIVEGSLLESVARISLVSLCILIDLYVFCVRSCRF